MPPILALLPALMVIAAGCETEGDNLATDPTPLADAEPGACVGGSPFCAADVGSTAFDSANVLIADSAPPPPPVTACSDGQDNDADGLIDLDDPDCSSADDDDETGEPITPVCSDQLDNDTDGYIDFPDDPGCGSPEDDDERDHVTPMPECSDGVDNDADGLVDISDPGCVSAADPREADPETAPACANQLDDDEDGRTDFPHDPGCSSAGDENEADDGPPPRCSNGADDDGDGRVDYPEDPGCAGLGDRSEEDPPVPPQCSDGQDNDRDGDVDYPDDRGCESAADGSEAGSCGRIYTPIELSAGRVYRGDSRAGRFAAEGTCGGRGASEVVFVYRVSEPIEALMVTTAHERTEIETALYIRRVCLDEDTELGCHREPLADGTAGNTLRVEAPPVGDAYIFLDGATGQGGRFALSIEEIPLAECLNLTDDDDDGLIDFPHDPGCDTEEDRSELDPPTPPACADDVDNDGDNRIDFPLDLGCESAADDDEIDVCGQGVRVYAFPADEPFIIGDTSVGASNAFAGSCGGGEAVEKVLRYQNNHSARITFSVDHEETTQNTLLYVREDCLQAHSEIDCDAGEAPAARGTVEIPRASPGIYYIFVDHPGGPGGPFKLSVEVELLDPGCVDGIDNDEDGFIDADDVGCVDTEDEDERDPPPDTPPAACSDGEDNDGDLLVDYPFDLGCLARGDDDEEDPEQLPECANGIDDDGDHRSDFPYDPGCQSRGDASEDNGFPVPECGNGRDDDNDGRRDYPTDPGCVAAGDLSEIDPEQVPLCADGEDNDRDGIVDFPYDPGCLAASANDETDPPVMPVCRNGEDDDGDGIIDFPRDPGCTYAAGPDETDPQFPPQCANGRDDDGDARIDFPDDPGCAMAADTLESSSGPVVPRCSDGIDNDDDGPTDLADVGCYGADDDDETDPDAAEIPQCADGLDNDRDAATDWPDDPGCAARGDVCEQTGFGLCRGVCVPIETHELHCGRCDRACPAGVRCVDGRCGQLRGVVMLCGQSSRDARQFIRGDLIDADVRVVAGCEPDGDTQALLVSRNGLAAFTQNAGDISEYVQRGGQVITEYNISHHIYNLLFPEPVAQGARNGSCQDNLQPVVQFTPNDPFWHDNEFVPLLPHQTGCGYSISLFPHVTPLGGWTPQHASFGYRDLGAGRAWLVDIDWQDSDAGMTGNSLDLMAYMIARGNRAGSLAACIDGDDNDEDGWIDLEDPGCEAETDESEEDPDFPPECADEQDNDDNGMTDFPLDTGCQAAGDDEEAATDDPPQCANGEDDDRDGHTDYPFDPGCMGTGDEEERDPQRLPACGNGGDDDEDDRIDFPWDPDCTSAADGSEEALEPGPPPACANGLDDDHNGIADFPFDLGCESAADDWEERPEIDPICFNGVDDDQDELADFPFDPGCVSAGDSDETDPRQPPACANGADDDRDGQVDFPADRGCRFAADWSEVDPFQVVPRCADSVDNDSDNLIDRQDPGCVDLHDDDEGDVEEITECSNDVDDDEDGLTDWPADPGCRARGDGREDQSCRPEVEVQLIEPNGAIEGDTVEEGEDHFSTRCGGREAPDAVARYILEAPADLVISAEHPETDYPVILSVRNDCEVPDALLGCAGDHRAPEPTVRVADAEPGEYYIFVDGGGPELWDSRGGPIALPPDPRNFVANGDVGSGCGWGDGGRDAFDCYGTVAVTHEGMRLDPVDVGLGERDLAVGPVPFHYVSQFAHSNVWRMRFQPQVEHEQRRVTLQIAGNLGSDAATVSAVRQVAFEGRAVSYFHTSDNFGAPTDPPVIHMVVPGDHEDLGAIQYANNGDLVAITATNVKLPVTFYVALSYGDSQAVAQALLQDINVQAGAGGADARRFGHFRLSVEEH